MKHRFAQDHTFKKEMGMINDTIKVTGELKITVTKPDGNTHETVVPNIVVTDGKEYIASRM